MIRCLFFFIAIIILSNLSPNYSQARILKTPGVGMDSAGTVTWGKISDGLQVGVSGDTNVIGMHVKNVGKKTVTILRKILTYENQYDWYHVDLIPVGGSDTIHLSLWEDRDRSVAIPVTLKSGEEFVEYVNLKTWGAKPINTEEVRLYAGKYQLNLSYSLNKKEDGGDGINWFGKINVGPVDFNISN